MSVRKIITIGDELLSKKCHEVTKFDDRLFALLDDMQETMRDSDGVGLAAPQVGILRRVVVIDVGEGYFELINPKIISCEGSQYGTEGCLSVPGKHGDVERPMLVTFEAYDRNGNKYDKTVEGLFARCVCHELDHLDGKLYVEIADNLADNE
ncbi:MAG: peptide deformylase [Clostridia bacterium]|nr:peptide deformylase [Clostridia bacterium]